MADAVVGDGRTLGPAWMETVFFRSSNLYRVSARYAVPERVSAYFFLKRLEKLGFEVVASAFPDIVGTAVAGTGVVGTGMLIVCTKSPVLTCSIFRSCSRHG